MKINDLPEIINWRRLNHRITLSGQPAEEQLSQIKELGITVIINLGPHTNKGALDDEPGTVAKLGIAYIYIPVDFENPTDEDYSKFCDAMERVENEQVHVHCIYNARVSAFFYRYAESRQEISVTETFKIMDSVWRPGNVWAKFIGNDNAIDQPHRFSGEDY